MRAQEHWKIGTYWNKYIKHQNAVHPRTAESKAEELTVNPLEGCREISPWQTKMNAEFSAPQIRRHHLTTCCCLFWVEKRNYLSASPAVDYINETSSRLEAVRLEFLGSGECGMCLGCLCSVQMPFFSRAFELLSEYTTAIKSCSQLWIKPRRFIESCTLFWVLELFTLTLNEEFC